MNYNRILAKLSVFALSLSIIYLILTYTFLSFNPFTWHWIGRFIFAAAIVTVLSSLFYKPNPFVKTPD
jgi:hypothetical protein